ncbi:LysR family transcriptional regulator [Roseibium sp.]|uniref:LysR family transcriptional regulator n=1 Tax=Roseibium sp. TaxID=1936156 RepID=UPI003B51E5D0
MQWDHLKTFLTFLREGSVRQAAKRLETTHSTVARQLKTLEADLGGPLFEPGAKNRELTPLGSRILPIAERMEKDAASIDRAAFAEDTSLAGPVRLSVSESLYLSVLAPVLGNFLQQFPMIILELVMSDQLTSLPKREADVVIRITKSPPDNAVGRKLADSPMCLYAAPSYLENRPKLDRWISIDYPLSKTPAIPARIAAAVDSAVAATHMIRMGQGIGMIPCYLGDNDPDVVRLPGFDPVPDMAVWILTHTDLKTNPRVRVLLDHLYGSFSDIRPNIEG